MLSDLRLLMEDEVLQGVTRSVWSQELWGTWKHWAPLQMGNKTGRGIKLAEHERGILIS